MPIILPKTGEPAAYNTNYILYWNSVALDLNRLTHSLRTGPQGGPPISARALCILHLAIHDAYFSVRPSATFKTYLEQFVPSKLPARPSGANDTRNTVAGAAITVLQALYTKSDPKIANNTTFELSQFLQKAWEGFSGLDTLSKSYRYGISVGRNTLETIGIKPEEPGADQGAYQPKDQEYYFGPDLSHPTRITPIDPNNPDGPKKSGPVYHGPFYGITAKRIAVQYTSSEHIIADPPTALNGGRVEWEDSIKDVHRMGGLPGASTTKRSPAQQAGALFWAYDGVNLIGTPPRLYNQIMRAIAWQHKRGAPDAETTNAEFARLFALANAAIADAGVICWQEKYHFEFWRPLTGVRQNTSQFVDPTWEAYGAPETNSNAISFKPPFPAYPSGHATFGGAFFQTLRLFYKERDNLPFDPNAADSIGFSFVSDELNGISRDLTEKYDPGFPITDQPGLIRTKVTRRFSSLWEAMWENAISRVWLGVHWRFDAFAAQDVLVPTVGSPPAMPYQVDANGATKYKPARDVTYTAMGTRRDRPPTMSGEPSPMFPIGGVPLGIGIATDIVASKLKPTPAALQPTSL